jgi:hypothetical protein
MLLRGPGFRISSATDDMHVTTYCYAADVDEQSTARKHQAPSLRCKLSQVRIQCRSKSKITNQRYYTMVKHEALDYLPLAEPRIKSG